MNSVHSKKVDIELNKTMRIISGTVKSTPLPWLSVLSNIAPPELRRWKKSSKLLNCCNMKSLLFEELQNLPENRLTFIQPIWSKLTETKAFNLVVEWRKKWLYDSPFNWELVSDPSTPIEGLQLL